MLVQQRVRERREPEQEPGRERAADELECNRAGEEPTQASPVLAGDVAEAELDQSLLDGQVEQALEEGGRGQHQRVEPERLGREDVQRDDRRTKPERR